MAMDNGENYRLFLSGEDEGLQQIISDHRKGLTLYLNSLVDDIGTAKELAFETFAEIAVKRPKYDGKSSFKTWLYSIGHNIARAYIRKQKRIAVVPLSGEEQNALVISLESAYIRDEERIMVHEALSAIAPQYRQVLYLSYFEELDNGEIAGIMKKNKRQVENMLYQAKTAMKKELERRGYVYGQR